MAGALASAGCGAVSGPDQVRGAIAPTSTVRFTSPEAAELWAEERVCRSPCERQLDVRGKTFEVRVPERPDPPTFALPPSDRTLVVQVHPSSPALVGAGATLGVVGGGALLVGGGVALLDVSGREDFAGTAPSGLITAAIGGAVLAGGIVCAALSGTRVTLKELAGSTAVRF